MSTTTDNLMNADRKRFGWLHVALFILATIVLTTIASVWIIKAYIFPTAFTPVTLSTKEERALNTKLERLEALGASRRHRGRSSTKTKQERTATDSGGALTPERYSEEGASRDITLTERELNALLAKNTDLASKVAIDLSDNLISAKLLLPVDEDFPVMGGQTLKVRAGVEMAYANGRPIVVLRGISVMGVPLPSAWLGDIKNTDLVKEFGGQRGFWKAFADGVDDIRVEEGRLKIKLKE
jgi:hypothetical protein